MARGERERKGTRRSGRGNEKLRGRRRRARRRGKQGDFGAPVESPGGPRALLLACKAVLHARFTSLRRLFSSRLGSTARFPRRRLPPFSAKRRPVLLLLLGGHRAIRQHSRRKPATVLTPERWWGRRSAMRASSRCWPPVPPSVKLYLACRVLVLASLSGQGRLCVWCPRLASFSFSSPLPPPPLPPHSRMPRDSSFPASLDGSGPPGPTADRSTLAAHGFNPAVVCPTVSRSLKSGRQLLHFLHALHAFLKAMALSCTFSSVFLRQQAVPLSLERSLAPDSTTSLRAREHGLDVQRPSTARRARGGYARRHPTCGRRSSDSPNHLPLFDLTNASSVTWLPATMINHSRVASALGRRLRPLAQTRIDSLARSYIVDHRLPLTSSGPLSPLVPARSPTPLLLQSRRTFHSSPARQDVVFLAIPVRHRLDGRVAELERADPPAGLARHHRRRSSRSC